MERKLRFTASDIVAPTGTAIPSPRLAALNIAAKLFDRRWPAPILDALVPRIASESSRRVRWPTVLIWPRSI